MRTVPAASSAPVACEVHTSRQGREGRNGLWESELALRVDVRAGEYVYVYTQGESGVEWRPAKQLAACSRLEAGHRGVLTFGGRAGGAHNGLVLFELFEASAMQVGDRTCWR